MDLQVTPNRPRLSARDAVEPILRDAPQADQEVEDDLEGEKDGFESVKQVVEAASKGVSQTTFDEYRRARDLFISFVVSQGWVEDEARDSIVGRSPHADTPLWIIAWIMSSCDSIDLQGNRKDVKMVISSYGHAQKWRASMTYWFGKEQTIGNTCWHMRDNGTWTGNPSISPAVSQYMASLRRRKVQDGITPVSARAITPDILSRIHHYNHAPENWKIGSAKPHARGTRQWGGPLTRRLLEAAYNIAFICLLRFDEVLRIQMKHIKMRTVNGEKCLELTLPFRKTNQFGGIKPFYLYYMDASEAHLCPVRALMTWVSDAKLSWSDNDAFLFPNMSLNDQPIPGKSMSSEKFLELFRNNMVDIGIDPITYGTHSFRRGGCQWLSTTKRWPTKRICDWGGWSQEFNTFTIVKYLWSANDDPIEPRDQFLNPNRPPVLKCYLCGRSCRCA